MKYSIVLPYYNRPELFNTLLSFRHHYKERKDVEIIIVEDSKNIEAKHDLLLYILSDFKDLNIIHINDPLESYSPCHKYNLGVSVSRGFFIVLSSPEIFHEENVLAGLDKDYDIDVNAYVVCSCKSVIFDKKKLDKFEDYKSYSLNPEYAHCQSWYQHSEHRNLTYHFCVGILKDNYVKIQGFDERYCKGLGFDDNSFLHRASNGGMRLVVRDDLVTLHIEHNKDYIKGKEELININKNLFFTQYDSGNFY
jgi:hypothetical protein